MWLQISLAADILRTVSSTEKRETIEPGANPGTKKSTKTPAKAAMTELEESFTSP